MFKLIRYIEVINDKVKWRKIIKCEWNEVDFELKDVYSISCCIDVDFF